MSSTRQKRLIGLTLTGVGAVTMINVLLFAMGVERPTILVALAEEVGFSQGTLFQTVVGIAIALVFVPAALFIGFPWAWKFVFFPIVRALIRRSARARCTSTDPY